MLRKAVFTDEKRKEKILSRTPLNRFGDPDDIGWAAVYLCSPAAKFVTGIVLPVDGGASIGF
jgi:gluconate 5-dehydrogenase